MSKAAVFRSKATPWDSGGEVVVWAAVALVTALFSHNIIRKWKQTHRR